MIGLWLVAALAPALAAEPPRRARAEAAEQRIQARRFGGGFSLGLTSASAAFRVRPNSAWLEHADLRLALHTGQAFNEPAGLVAGMQFLTVLTGELALLPERRWHPVVSVSAGVSFWGLRYRGGAPAALAGGGLLVSPRGPFEFRVVLHGGLVGHARRLEHNLPAPGFGLAYEMGWGAVW